MYPVFEINREFYYWVAILFSNNLRAVLGDFLSDNLGFSYWVGAAITEAIVFIAVLLHSFKMINRIVLFWIAFIFTRSFGATFGDFLTRSKAEAVLISRSK